MTAIPEALIAELKRKAPGRTIDRRLKPCPDLMKGRGCPVCGAAYVCLDSARIKESELARFKESTS